MNLQTVFQFFNTAILLPWLLLIVLPKWKGTQWMVSTRLPVLIVAIAYLVIAVWDMSMGQGEGLDFSSIDALQKAFMRDEVMLIGWLHYLAFDLFVGMWEWTDAKRISMPHYVLVPCLVFTLMLGPIGFVLYWVFRQWYVQKGNSVT